MSNSHFIPWLQKQLQVRDIKADAPEMPMAYNPEYVVWTKELERFDINPDTILVGHSCGAGFLIRWLSEHRDVQVHKLILVAPWLNTDNEVDTKMFDFVIDLDLDNRFPVIVFESTNDEVYINNSVKKLRSDLPEATYTTFTNHGHFCTGDIGPSFPMLLEEILK